MFAARKLHGVVMNPEHVVLSWYLRFAVKDRDGLTAFQRAYQWTSYPRATLAAWSEKALCVDATKQQVGVKDWSEELNIGRPSGC